MFASLGMLSPQYAALQHLDKAGCSAGHPQDMAGDLSDTLGQPGHHI